VRLDSGDLGALAMEVRSILDAADLPDVRILASGDLDEYRIAELVAADAPVDAFGVGTRMGTSADAPSLGVVYKLVQDDRGPKMKLAEGKATLPGRKQIWRLDDHDLLALEGEDGPGGRALLQPPGREPVSAARDRFEAALRALPDHLRVLDVASPPYAVHTSAGLDALVERLTKEHRR
jgi:nicotinate phosphoribosyltransferase